MSRGSIAGCVLACACGPNVIVPVDDTGSGGDDDSTTVTAGSATTTGTSTTTTGATSSDPDSEEGVIIDDFGSGGGGTARPLDLLVVVDNSMSMGEEQRALARAMPELVDELAALMNADVVSDVQVMFTTSDFGNPLCTPFEPPGYAPAQGAPTTTGCNARIDNFTGLGTMPLVMPEVCTSVCPTDVVPADPFVAFGGDAPDAPGDNVPGSPDEDIDGDGVLDTAVPRALACLAPQGINGCGYEAPLETMLQAINPAAPWNQGDRPFLRPEAALAVVIVSDESDCSVNDYSIMSDESYMATNPDTGTPQSSSAICWNAGVSCVGPDAQGVYSECVPIDDDALHAPSRYIDVLRDELVLNQGKPVYMLALVGVPAVTERASRPPYQPLAGGLFDLVYRDWRDPEYPLGDILPSEWKQGVMAADKRFDFGIGPACTGEDGGGGFIGQGLPSPRVVDVCQSLDGVTAPIACCVESVCDNGYETALRCLTGMLEAARRE